MDLAFDTVNNAEAAVRWMTQNGDPIAAGIDTLTMLSTGEGGWRPADRWLRQHYAEVRESVLSPNSLRGAMVVSGLAVLSCLHEINPDILVSETHPKILYSELTDGQHYNYAANQAGMNVQLAQWIGWPVDTTDGHQWDALASCLAVWKGGVCNEWHGDLHNQLHAGQNETLVSIVGPTHYYWPIMPDQVM